MNRSRFKLRYLIIPAIFACAVLGPFGSIVALASLAGLIKLVLIFAVFIFIVPRLYRWLKANF